MERYLVVGGAGFIGSRLVLRLLGDAHDVSVLDNFSTGRPENLKAARNEVRLWTGDMRDQELVDKAMQGVDRVALLAAIPSVARSVEDPRGTHNVNVDGALTVLVSARKSGVNRVVFSSSAAVYGKGRELPKSESLCPAPASPYGVAKLCTEQHCRVFRELYGLPAVTLRYFNVFGPHQNPDSEYASAVPRFMRQVSRGERPTIFGTGQQSRDFVYVENVVTANVLALGESDPGAGPFNVGTGHSTTVLDLVALIGRTFGREVDPEFLPGRPGDVIASQADISRARTVLGYTPRVSLEEGLAAMANWLQSSGTLGAR